jgi:hypothetical protein
MICGKDIMLHFSPNNPYVVYIGVCDWGEVGQLQEVTSSLYEFSKEHDAINTRKLCWWVALELFLFIVNLEL